jgi:hypothetical protein
MKKIKSISLFSIAALIILIQTGCFGSFSLTRKVYNFNARVGDKFVNELVFLVFVVVPVYEISGLIDAVILNFIEFWSGSNPVAMIPGQTETQQVKFHGKLYNVTASHNLFHLESIDKKVIQDLIYNEKTATWTYVANNKSIDVCTFNSNGSLTIHKANKTDCIYSADVLKKLENNNSLALK